MATRFKNLVESSEIKFEKKARKDYMEHFKKNRRNGFLREDCIQAYVHILWETKDLGSNLTRDVEKSIEHNFRELNTTDQTHHSPFVTQELWERISDSVPPDAYQKHWKYYCDFAYDAEKAYMAQKWGKNFNRRTGKFESGKEHDKNGLVSERFGNLL